MPVHRQKNTTPPTPGSTQEQTVPPLPDPQTFQQYLRELARGAIRVVLEGVMREELDALIGVGWGESIGVKLRTDEVVKTVTKTPSCEKIEVKRTPFLILTGAKRR